MNFVLRKRSRRGLLTGLLLIALVVALDYWTGTEISFSIFYVAPIARVAWQCGPRWGFSFAILGALAWYGADQFGGHVTSHPVIPVWNALARLGLFGLTVYAATQLRAALDRERSLARRDPLTQLANARAFRELTDREIERMRRYGETFAAAYIDVDNFKWVNDNLGHQAGDTVLANVGRTLQHRLRKSDHPARLGGDEFVVLMPNTDATSAQIAMDKVVRELRKVAADQGWPISFSVGVVCFQKPPRDVDQVIQLSDKLMYRVKQSGKNAILAQTYEQESVTTVS